MVHDNKWLLVVVGIVFLFLSPLYGVGSPSDWSYEFGPGVSYITYREQKMNDKGWLFGIEGACNYSGDFCKKLWCSQLRAEGRFYYGEVDYDGQTWGGTPLQSKGEDEIIFEARGLIRKDYEIHPGVVLTPYIGLGYRYLNNHGEEGIGGYERQSNYLYSPIAIEIFQKQRSDWMMGLAVEYDIFWMGWQTSRLSDVGIGFEDVTNEQHSGYGFRVSLKFLRHYNKSDLIIEPYFMYWDIDNSETDQLIQYGIPIGYVFEPANETEEFGLRIIWRR